MGNSIDFKNIISKSLSDLTKIISSKGKLDSVVGIDIGSSAIKIVQLKKSGGKAILETYGVLALGPYDKKEVGAVTNLGVESISKALIDVIKESNVTTKISVVAIPSSSSLIFTISLPAQVNESQLANIIPLEARKYIPVPIGEVTLDWFVIPQEVEDYVNDNIEDGNAEKMVAESKLEVLVVAIHNDILSKYRDILEKTELKASSFEMEIFSSVRATLGHEISPILIIDLGASKTKIYIVEAGVVLVFHVINRGSQDITRNISQAFGISFDEAEKLKRNIGLDDSNNKDVAEISRSVIDYILTDTNSVVFAYEKRYNKTIGKVILVGGGSSMKGLHDHMKKSFHTEVIYGNPFSKVEAPAFLEPVLEASGPEFSIAVGLALRQLSQ